MNITHHGQYIEKIIRRNGHSISDIARLTSVNRRSVYNWFNLPRLKPSTILAIGKAMKYDFSGAFPELALERENDGMPFSDTVDQDQKVLIQINYWKDKYIELLEKYAELLSLKSEEELRELM
ncbi:MAG TPA: hypothetical protein VKB19_11240 [Pedobacter sp.]|nr:hypothetical protein [Pedobacter sp.]